MYCVVINAGHSCIDGEDHGACRNDLRECDINRDVARDVCSVLVEHGVNAIFIQDDSLTKICDVANCAGADLFVSIHCNSVVSPNAEGTEVYTYDKASKANVFAVDVCWKLTELMKTVNRGLKYRNYWVLANTAMPAALIELFFISNIGDIQKYYDHKMMVGETIAESIIKYLKEGNNGNRD